MRTPTRRDIYDIELPLTPPSSVFKRRHYDDEGKRTDSWYDHVPKSPFRHKKNLKKSPASPKKAEAANKPAILTKKRPISQTGGFNYRAVSRPSKAAERFREAQRIRRKDIPTRPMPHYLSSAPCAPGRGFVPPKRISPCQSVVTGVQMVKKGQEVRPIYQVKDFGKYVWVTADMICKESVNEFIKNMC